jgi:sulfatase modifying factor 1
MNPQTAPNTAGTDAAPPGPAPKDMQWVPAGSFLMGSELSDYLEESPVRPVAVSGFWIDRSPVTVMQFRRFVKATGYVTVAERPLDPADYPRLDPRLLVPGSQVFTPTSGPVDLRNPLQWWRYVPGASWRAPLGPGTRVDGIDKHPVVHVCWEDVEAYAQWAAKDLPTEAEWEYAARGGLEGALYTWGDEVEPRGRTMANKWAGDFPWRNLKPVSRTYTSPVGSYPANGYGLYDMAGNVWEWTSDFYRSRHPDAAAHACCAPVDPRISDPEGSHDPHEPGGAHIPRRVIKGGSHLCSPEYCHRYRPAARQAQQVESGMSHVGFRCVLRP